MIYDEGLLITMGPGRIHGQISQILIQLSRLMAVGSRRPWCCATVIYHGARGGRTTAFTSFHHSTGGGISVAIGTAIIRGRTRKKPRRRRRRRNPLRLNVSTDKRGPDLLSFHKSWLILAIGEGNRETHDRRKGDPADRGRGGGELLFGFDLMNRSINF